MRERRCSSSCCWRRRFLCSTASSVHKSRLRTSRLFSHGCNAAAGSSSRCSSPATSSTGCPFVLVRDTGRRIRMPSLRWPRWLRVKWIGIALFVAVLFIYELYDLWALPRATAWIVLGYFAIALAVDLLFTGATFCKYLCPIGQFSFVASTMSPLELQVKQPDTCRTCRTVDCIKGRRDEAVPSRVLRRGCELALFLPAKTGNLDCTFCLDCVQACPHDNIAVATRVPGLELIDSRRRSGIGWLPVAVT